MDINFELYKIFYHTAKAQSFSAAADILHVSQSAVSQSIKSLEEKLGSQLFLRKTREIKLTVEGEILFKHIEQAYNFIKTAEHKIYQTQNLERGEIRIGVSDTICKYYLISYIEKFIKNYPSVKIQVINRTSSQIQDILKKGLIDFGIVTLPVQDNKIHQEEFLTVEDIFVASDRFSELKNQVTDIKSLASYPLLMLDRGTSTRRNIDSYLSSKGISILPEIELESIDLLVEFAKIGLGIALVLKESVIDELNKGTLFEVKLKENITLRKLGVITMKNVPLSRASSEFIKLLRI
ncbi:LysR family transcriptional regulator [Acetivibrio mesophilus]|uniref:LysR family transcriptional regulator n=1 Tax=Acetivibrio mesophilus TaxID=2487273 RepID=A0A4Q0I737_9FIRM|nr:LysR family transcriptional regulator [Acetivibrio mesophilus]ODM25617.1 LysR family transcriptional regulator [Clostridium sp. Bc-iso-3]RXE60201.1 LysR family transcriptional regulator [Acetivibrio mesophilus]HHV29034.1 LysR family transcriptional regulator [Clostridium sp.]